MFNVETLDKSLIAFLVETKVENERSNTFTFRSKEQFTSAFSAYYFLNVAEKTFYSFEPDETFEKDVKLNILKLIGDRRIDEICNDIMSVLNRIIGDVSYIYLNTEDYSNLYLSEIRQIIQNVMYEAISNFYKTPYMNDKGSRPSTREILYAVLFEDGKVHLLDKDTTLLKEFHYGNQEDAVAHIVHFNAETTIIYDHLNLLHPEMVICLKRFLGERVNFIGKRYPIHPDQYL